ncbi:MAG: hypothetical protein EXR73_09425 [Myxococcales bacterium]|nr:hypothetical protein [Myxococcales bacterium]
MDETTRAGLDEITRDSSLVLDAVDNAFEEHATFWQQVEARKQVDALMLRFREIDRRLSETDRLAVDRSLGRKLRDLTKTAARLPAPPAGSAASRPSGDDFLGTRAISASSSRLPRVIGVDPAAAKRAAGSVRVGDDLDCWCGPCADMKSHTIIAVMEGVPVQVVCRRCGSRHKHRQAPARGTTPGLATRTATQAGPTDTERRADDKRKLVDELQSAASVRTFVPNERYRSGEIIQHAEWGRGKIENTLPRSLVVRFASGIKQVKLA